MHAHATDPSLRDPAGAARVGAAAGSVALLIYGTGAALGIAGAPIAGLALAGAVTAILWVLLSIRRPDAALAITVFVWVLAYARLSLQVLELAGPTTSNRGALAIADLLWAGLVFGLLLRRATWDTDLRQLDTPFVWAMVPYIVAAIALPMLGVVFGGFPAGFATPAVRFVQWASFFPIAYVVARDYGPERLFRLVVGTLIIAGLLHAAYGVIQLAVQLGWLGPMWTVLDDLYARNNEVAWFFFARVTGLLVNPNHYGLLAVFVLVVGVSWIIGGSRHFPVLKWLAVLAAVIPIVLTGSRSAFVAALAVAFFWGAIALAGDRAAVRLIRMLPALLGVAVVAMVALWNMVPEALQNRYRRLLAVFLEGTGAEQNLTLRIDMWREAWRAFMSQYPAGTWVPPSYALGMPIDSYFVFTAVQGTPLLTVLWMVMMAGMFLLGFVEYRRRRTADAATAGLILAGWSIVMVVSSLTMSPLLQIQLSSPLWTMTGLVMALRTMPASPQS